jgi:hypothetical protein
MKYFIDTEFLEGTQDKTFLGFKYGSTKPTIDLISIGIVAEDGREYYAISKDFNLKEAWNRFDLIKKNRFQTDNSTYYKKVYWIRENVLKPIFIELLNKQFKNTPSFYDKYNNGLIITNDELIVSFDYKLFVKLINKYGKTNKQIAHEIKEFCTVNENRGNGILEQIEGFKDNTDRIVRFYGYYADYDWVVFCWLFGRMVDLPKGFPMYCIDLKQDFDFYNNNFIKRRAIKAIPKELEQYNSFKDYPNYPKQTNEHNALADARWNYELYKFLNTV